MKFIEYRGDKISKLSLGTVQFGLDYGIANSSGQPTQDSVNQIIEYLYNNKVNCFDTAQAYGNSEEVLGKAIKNKSQLHVISKLKSDIFISNAIENVEESLQNLNISSLYALLLHDSELLYKWSDEYDQIIQELKNRDKIKYFGVSIYTNEDFELAINNKEIEFIQIPFNIFDQRAISQGWIEKAKRYDKLIFIRSIFLQGLFFMDRSNLPKNLEQAKEPLNILDKYSKKLEMSLSELALNFVDSTATDSLLLFGCDNIEQAKENIVNYNQLKKLDTQIISDITKSFKDVDDSIYNPTKW